MRKDQVINDVQTITFDKSKYKNESEFWEIISAQLNILTKNNYECKFYYEDCDIYVLEFAHENHKFGGSSCVWVTCEEHEDIYFRRQEPEDEVKPEEEVVVSHTPDPTPAPQPVIKSIPDTITADI